MWLEKILFHFIDWIYDCFLYSLEVFNLVVYFCFCFYIFWYYAEESLVSSNRMKLFPVYFS